jgi:UDP-glucose 4-epimerase
MRVLVVGGAGYIGSHVVRAFLDAGHEVTVMDNFYSGLRRNLFPEAEFIHGDITNPRDLRCAFSGAAGPFEAAVHLAAFKAVGESMTDPDKYSYNNISGTLNLLSAMKEFSVRRLVFSSSAAVYGMPKYVPVDEKHPLAPISYYGFTKLEIERFLAWYDQLVGIRSASLRYFNAAGYDPSGRITGLELNPGNLLPIIMEVAAGIRDQLEIFGNDYDTPDGTCIRDYVHVTDLAAAHVSALEWIDGHDESLTVNLGSETGFSVLEMLETARKVTQRPIPARVADRRPGDPAKLVASAAFGRDTLDFRAANSNPETLVETTWNVYRSNFGIED